MNLLYTILLAISVCHVTDGKKYATCREKYFGGSTKSGIKRLQHDGYVFKAFCQYNNDGTGWFFPSRQAVKDNSTFTLNLEDQYDHRDQAKVRVFLADGSQKDSVLEQRSTYPLKNLTFMINTAAGFKTPSNTIPYGPHYLYLGFLPYDVANKRTPQGWRADGQDISFTNCDANPNSYFAFYEKNTYSSKPYGLGTNYATTNTWRGGVNGLTAVSSEHSVPSVKVGQFTFAVEIHFGGCGVIEVSNDWATKTTNSLNATGAALGLKFDMNDRCGPGGVGVCKKCGDCRKSPDWWVCKGARNECSLTGNKGKLCCCLQGEPSPSIKSVCKPNKKVILP